MKKHFALLLSVLFFSACNLSGSDDKYAIEGNVKNYPGKTVILEKLGLQAITAVDSATIDEKGNFQMQGVSEKGFYRIKLNDQAFWLFLLEPVKYKVDLDLKAQDAFKITGSPENDEFQVGVKKLNEVQGELQQLQYAYMMYQQMKTSPDTIAMVGNALNEAAKRMETVCLEGAKKAKSPLVSMFYITNAPFQNYAKENLEVLTRMEKEIPNSSYTKDFRKAYNQYEEKSKAAASAPQAEDVSVGKKAPEINLNNPDGKPIALSSLKGKVVLIDFWASWCGPCKAEMPNVVAAYNKYKSKGFTVYSVSLDRDAAAWKKSIAALGMTWENQVSDLKFWNCEAAVRYGVNGIPATFLIDREGVIIANNLRGEALDQKLAELLK